MTSGRHAKAVGADEGDGRTFVAACSRLAPACVHSAENTASGSRIMTWPVSMTIVS